MEVFKISNPIEAIQFAEDCLIKGHEGLDIFLNKSTFLQTGISQTSDIKMAKKLGIPVWKAKHLGGSIVCFDGDLSLCLTTYGNRIPDFGEQCMEAISSILRAIGAEVTVDNNDVLSDGKKVASWARATTIDGWVQTVIHYSVNMDINLVRKICTKPMNKIPGALSDYDITADDILQELVKRGIIKL